MAPNKKQGGRQKSLRRFATLFEEGVTLLGQDTDQEAAAEKLLQAVYAAPSVWTKHRFFAFGKALAVKATSENSNTLREIEEEVTESFIHNENEPAHFRSLAAMLVAHCYDNRDCMNMNTGAELTRLGLDIIQQQQSPNNEDENRRIGLFAPYIPYQFRDLGPNDVTVASILQLLAQHLQTYVSHFEGRTAKRKNNPESDLYLQRFYAGGKMCDCCGKTLEELQMQSLKRCGRCTLVFYCSEKCQKEDWTKKGHRKACRKPGQIVVGDEMAFFKDGKNSTPVEVMARSLEGEEENRWQVKFCSNGRVVSVDGDKLVRLRPRPPQSSAGERVD